MGPPVGLWQGFMKKIDLITIPIKGSLVALRDAVADDLEHYRIWQRQGEWREFDAPWEHADPPAAEKQIEEEFDRRFLSEPSLPRKRLIIALPDNRPVGWVNRYGDKRFSSCCYVGIDICDDNELNRGLGTDALRLWVGHIFAGSEFHRVAFATYSFNDRVVRLAQKLRFTFEGRDREIVQWQGKWVDRLHFGLLRSEWESHRPDLTF
jgi:RimJ/RimL family protein N-acetyltransferase